MSNMRVYAEIDLDAISRNARAVRQAVGSKTKIMAVVKADGYGHGAVMSARAVNKTVDAFAVATIEEAIELRENGIDKEILILGYILPDYYDFALKYDISLTVFTFEMAKALSDCAKQSGKTAKIHIAVDTGMGRIGFFPTEESADEIKKISLLENLEIDGLFSHFATADEADKEYSRSQIEKYNALYNMLKKRGVDIKLRHICNSAGTTELPDCLMDMVRMGIIMYGLYPSDEVDKSRISLEGAMSIKSSVVYIKTIKPGESVSYGRRYIAKRDTVVATIPVGYADGYPRQVSNKSRVLINGEYAPVIGNVCMDQMMVDVTDIKNVSVGDDVILVGRQGNNEVTFEEIAALAGTINYEIICGIGKRVPRIYKQEVI